MIVAATLQKLVEGLGTGARVDEKLAVWTEEMKMARTSGHSLL
jgi:hypothetical protein